MIRAIASASFSGVQERMSIPALRQRAAAVLLYSGTRVVAERAQADHADAGRGHVADLL
jgi:hypothetical protein